MSESGGKKDFMKQQIGSIQNERLVQSHSDIGKKGQCHEATEGP